MTIDSELKRWYMHYRRLNMADVQNRDIVYSPKFAPAVSLDQARRSAAVRPLMAYYPTFYNKPSSHKAGGERFFEKNEMPWCVEAEEAHKVVDFRDGHTGWYNSDHHSSNDLLVGAVLKLRHKRGYLAAYREECNDGYLVDCGTIYDDATDAARAGDSLAERHAETEREYQEVWQAGQDCATARDDALTERECLLHLVATWREFQTQINNVNQLTRGIEAHLTDEIRQMVMQTIRGTLDHMYKARADRDKYLDGYFRGDHIGAFNEGFGEDVLDERGNVIWSVARALPKRVETVSTDSGCVCGARSIDHCVGGDDHGECQWGEL